MRTLTIAALAFLLTSSAVYAQSPIRTAAPMDAAPPGARGFETQAPGPLDDGPDTFEPAPGVNFCGGPARLPDGSNAAEADRIHGEVGAAVGTRGYRDVHLAACKPLGAGGGLAIEIDQTQYSSGHRSHN
jgi:hypothetical protein